MVSAAEKYATEIEIFTLSSGFRAQISHNCAQKRRFPQSVWGQSGRIDFFNTIGPKLSTHMLSAFGGFGVEAAKRLRETPA
jgi:hypothetical protein